MLRKTKAGAARQSIQARRRARRTTRMRLLAAFQALGHGADAIVAREQLHAYYRASGAEWTRCLT